MFWSCGTTVFRRPAGGALCVSSNNFHRRLALLPSALFCGVLAPVPAGCSQFGTGAAVSYPNWISLFPATSFLARVAVTRTRRLGQTLSGSYLLSLLP